MATVAFTSFLPEVLPQLPSCSDLVAVNAVRNACIDFCAGSLFWNETQDVETVDATAFPFYLTAPSGAHVVQVMSVSVDGTPIGPIFLDALESVVGWSTKTADMPVGYVQPNPDQLLLYPAPAKSLSMVMRCAYAPTRTATGIESYVYQEYLEEIAAGAMAKLMKMPGRPWSNPETGLYYSDVFEKAISDAATRVNKSFSRAGLSVAMRAFA